MAPTRKSGKKRTSRKLVRKNLPELVQHVSLMVNGKKVERDVDSRMTLAEFLREKLGLTGTKVGCNRGECGSCTVLLDGRPIYSCTSLVVELAGREVLTIEGLAVDDNLHPIQEAFIEHDSLPQILPGKNPAPDGARDKKSHRREPMSVRLLSQYY